MTWLPDTVVDRLRSSLLVPDLSGTRYRIMRFLAQGGMAAVWLAEDTVLQRQVALKILSTGENHNDLAARLLGEAKILASLEHPGIVPVHDAGTLADGRVFCCMKYVQGDTLEQHALRAGSVPERLRLVLRIAEPLAFAHARGILHRDLKPGNIMIGPFGEVLVMDWGLAKRVDDHAIETKSAAAAEPVVPTNKLATGVVGTPGFMAPEQARGEPATSRSDVYSLGAVMDFLLRTCATDGCANSMARALRAICAKAMATDPSQRYDSVESFAADVSNSLERAPVSAYRESLFERAARVMNRHAAAIVLILVYLSMRALLIFFARR